MFMTFYGEPRGDKHTHEHAHESPMTMIAPLGVSCRRRGICRHDLVQAVSLAIITRSKSGSASREAKTTLKS